MYSREASPEWQKVHTGRECGDCYACCVYLGITELKKHTGQTCKHLDGTIPTKRCTIYNKRPIACVEYQCMWREGMGDDDLRPADCGMLVTPYRMEDGGPGCAITVMIFDPKKATKLDHVIEQLLVLGVTELRVVNWHTKKALYFAADGNIYDCKIIKPDGYESLNFESDGEPLGRFISADRSNPEEETRLQSFLKENRK